MPNIVDILKKIDKFFTPPVYVMSKKGDDAKADARLVTYYDKYSYVTEQYKVLRTNLYSLSPQSPIKTIVITSTQAQEGKSVTSCNLAYALSLDSDKKVLLVDADFRKPAVHKVFKIPRKPGFIEVFKGEADIENFIKKPVLDNLYIITSGTIISNPSEFLSSLKMKNYIERLKEKFDYIIFDTPPVINVTDSSILGAMCDCLLMVVRMGVTPKNMVEEAVTMLKHAQAKPKACILTGASIPFYYYYMGRYKYYYHYRYGYQGTTRRSY
ncbi:MAG: CpsD/CapB family tyrosine-protein kinase [Candidatus Omnitrophica bacterium]|nr:CpsD/CapB family tyrosine-protein kinase [Candidatus Omnitrophota bacterium]